MNIIAIMALVFAAGLGTGGYTAYQIQHSKVVEIELQIAKANEQAHIVIEYAKAKVALAETKQIETNKELDKAHEDFIKTANAYDVKLDNAIAGMLYTSNSKSGTDPVPKGDSAGQYKGDDTQWAIVSRELLQYLAEESKRADRDGADKNTLLTFVRDQNCGIRQ
jgi:hypothetical protein